MGLVTRRSYRAGGRRYNRCRSRHCILVATRRVYVPGSLPPRLTLSSIINTTTDSQESQSSPLSALHKYFLDIHTTFRKHSQHYTSQSRTSTRKYAEDFYISFVSSELFPSKLASLRQLFQLFTYQSCCNGPCTSKPILTFKNIN